MHVDAWESLDLEAIGLPAITIAIEIDEDERNVEIEVPLPADLAARIGRLKR